MKVCILSYEAFPIENGITISLDRISRNLALRDIEVHIVTFSKPADNGNSFFNENFKVNTELRGKVKIHRISPFSGNVQYPSPQEMQEIMHQVKILHRKHGFDLIHGFRLVPAGFAAVMIAKELKIPSLVSIRGNDVGRNIFDFNLFAMSKFVLDNADKLSFVASDLMSIADNVTPMGNRASVISNSFDKSNYMYRKDITVDGLKGLVVGFCGVVRQKKGFSYLVDAVREFSKKNEATLLLIGDFVDEEKAKYIEILSKANINFVKTGIVKNKFILNYLKYVDIFVLPSLTEGCSNAMLEAMYLKIPTICSNVGGAADILKNEDSSLLVDSRDSVQILNSIKKLKSTELRNRLSLNAFNIILQLQPTDEADMFIEAYKELTN